MPVHLSDHLSRPSGTSLSPPTVPSAGSAGLFSRVPPGLNRRAAGSSNSTQGWKRWGIFEHSENESPGGGAPALKELGYLQGSLRDLFRRHGCWAIFERPTELNRRAAGSPALEARGHVRGSLWDLFRSNVPPERVTTAKGS